MQPCRNFAECICECVYVCRSECDPPGSRSKQFSVKWLVHNLIDRQIPSFSLSPHRSSPTSNIPLFLLYRLTSYRLLLHSILPPPFSHHVCPALHFSSLPPFCCTLDDINTSLCLRGDCITFGNTTHSNSTSAIWTCVCLSMCVQDPQSTHVNMPFIVKVNGNRSTKSSVTVEL